LPATAFILAHLLVLLALTATLWAAGRLAAGRLASGTGAGTAWEGAAVAVALGLGVFGHLGLFLGLAGALARGPVLAAMAVVLACVALLGWRRRAAHLRPLSHRPPFPRERRERLGWSRRWIVWSLGATVVLGPIFALALYPPTGFDETLYHLPFAREFVRSGGVPFLPQLRVPVFPQLSEVLFAEVMMLAGDVATHLVELLATLATAALLVGWGRRAASPAAGWLAAGIWLGNPIVVHLAGTAYVEPGLALFAAAAVHAQERWRETGGRGWLVLAAFFAASAGDVKYLGLAVAGIVFVLVVLGAPPGRRLRDPLLYAAVCAAVLAPWYLRIVYFTGNPLFPFFPSVLSHRLTAWDEGGAAVPRPLGKRLGAFLRVPWDVVFNRRNVGWQPPYSPVYLLGLPVLFAGVFRDGRVRRLAGFGGAYSLLFLLLPPDSRYLLPALPVVGLALALAAARWARPRLLAALALVALLPGWLYASYRVVQQGPVPATAAARDGYLADRLAVWPAIRYLNRARGRRYVVYALHAENMVYLAEGTLLGDWNGPARFADVEPLIHDPPALHRKLRDLGADHLLAVDCCGIVLPEDDPEFRRLFRRVYSDGTSAVFALR
jgi:Dolichyl-phosphate-mannose-protein mannosyltransferase